MSIYQNQYYTKEDTEEPEYETPDFSKGAQNRGKRVLVGSLLDLLY